MTLWSFKFWFVRIATAETASTQSKIVAEISIKSLGFFNELEWSVLLSSSKLNFYLYHINLSLQFRLLLSSSPREGIFLQTVSYLVKVRSSLTKCSPSTVSQISAFGYRLWFIQCTQPALLCHVSLQLVWKLTHSFISGPPPSTATAPWDQGTTAAHNATLNY